MDKRHPERDIIPNDLFGGEISSNSADFFAAGLRGRYRERELFEDHIAADGVLKIEVVEDNQVKSREAPLRNALNEVLRGEYAKDCERGLARWNKILADEGVAERLYLPSRSFHRRVGEYAKHCFDIHGADFTGRIRAPRLRVAADRAGPRIRPQFDDACDRAGKDRQLDRAAGDRNQSPAFRFRVCAPVARQEDGNCHLSGRRDAT